MIDLAELPCSTQPLFTPRVIQSLVPRPQVRTWDWITTKGRTPDGKPFDGARMPWAEGVCDAYDDPSIRMLVLMWGTRLGKSMISMEIMACNMATRPLPGFYTTSTEKLAIRSVGNKIYPILESIEETRTQLPPPHKRNVRELSLTESTWAVAWAGSNTLLSDWDAAYGWGQEIDKWIHKKSEDGQAKEGHSVAQFLERFKDWPDHKIVLECSPSIANKSQIEANYLLSNQCQYQVPCPKCGRYQVLEMGSKDPKSTGLVWDILPNGDHDLELARQSARYRCCHCRYEIHDHERRKMMRAGRWVAKGQRIGRTGKLLGTPERQGTIWGGQLSSLYSLQMRWGDIAAKFVSAKASYQLMQMFVNGWLARTWEPYRSKSKPEQVGERLACDYERGKIPAEANWLFGAVDVQDEYFVWMVAACGPDERIYLVDWGYCDTWGEIKAEVLTRKFEHMEHPDPLSAAMVVVDSGDGKRTREVYKFCRANSKNGIVVMPVKGANTNCNGEPYQKVTIGEGTKGGKRTLRRHALAARGIIYARVNSFYWEPVLQAWLDDRYPGEDDSLSIPADAAEDMDLLEQLCNAAQSDEPSKMEPDKVLWVKRWEQKPNDLRDCLKYLRCAMEMKFRGDWRKAARPQTIGAEPEASPVAETPGESRSQDANGRGRRRGGRTRTRRQRRR